MAEAMTARATAAPAQAGGVLSADRGGTVGVSLRDVPNPIGYLAIGTTSGSPPTTYAGIGSDSGGAVLGGGLRVSVTYDADAGLYALDIQQKLEGTGFTEGQTAWAAWFEGSLDLPGPTDTPTLVSAGMPVIA